MGGPETAPAALVDWIESRFAGTVVRAQPLARWRAGWFVDVERDGELVELYARGARGPDFPSPFTLAHEVAVTQLLAAHGFPVAATHGIVELADREVLVMDRVPGVQGVSAEPDPAARQRLMLDCVDLIARMHSIPMEDVARYGFDIPRTSSQVVWSGAIARLEAHYLTCGQPLDPVIEFLRRWLRRNEPAGRDRPAFVTWDAAQFLHAGGRITALIDFELAHVGDPYMDLAPLRSRDTIEPFGDLHEVFARYEALTGAAIDYDVVRYFEVAQLTATLMLQRPVILAPAADSDLMTHIVWYVESARYAFDVIAELHRKPLDLVAAVAEPVSRHAVSHSHLVRSLHAAARSAVDPADRWRARCDYRLARHLERIDGVGAQVDAAELDDVATVLGQQHQSLAAADVALVEVITRAGPERDLDFVRYLDRRMQRASMLLGPPQALSTQHVPLQALPDRG